VHTGHSLTYEELDQRYEAYNSILRLYKMIFSHLNSVAVCLQHTLNLSPIVNSSNQMARWFLNQGVQPGDVTAVMVPNCPTFVITWLALAKLVRTLITSSAQGVRVSLTRASPVIILHRAV